MMLGTPRYILRLLHILWTLARHGTFGAIEHVPHAPRPLIRLVGLLRRRSLDAMRPGERMAAALVALGPSFVKLGQSVATRPDLIGEQTAHDLSRLQHSLEPFSADLARATIESELQGSIESLFSAFDDTPVAAASIAQVHRATTTEGMEVAVKVLRPRIEARFARDIGLFRWVSRLMERYMPWLRWLRPVEVVELFAETVALELDLRLEAAAAAELAENFKGDRNLKVPAVDWMRTRRRVFTLEWLDGTRPDDHEGMRAAGHDPNEVVRKSAVIFFHQVFRDGFFHADMHPGNVLVLEDGRIAPLDFGIMGRLDMPTRHVLADLLSALLARDYHQVAQVYVRAGFVPRHKSVEAFAQACRAICEPILGRPLADISLARLLGHMLSVTRQFDMEVQPQLLVLQKTMVVAEGVGRQLNDQINIWNIAHPLIEDWLNDTRSPPAQARQMVRYASDFSRQLPIHLLQAEQTIRELGTSGIRLHPETLRGIRAGRSNGLRPAWLFVLMAVLLALALLV